MAILHGSWTSDGQFRLWGEVWRKVKPVEVSIADAAAPEHPLALPIADLKALIAEQLPKVDIGDWQSDAWAIAQPTPEKKKRRGKNDDPDAPPPLKLTPQHSADKLADPIPALYPWQVEGYSLTPEQTVPLLEALPLGLATAEQAWMGGDLRFWSHAGRWSLDLITRSKYFPSLKQQEGGEYLSCWEPLLDGRVDRDRFVRLTTEMPAVCRCYGAEADFFATPLLLSSAELLRLCLRQLLNAQIKPFIPGDVPPKVGRETKAWLESLGAAADQARLEPEAGQSIQEALHRWALPLQTQLQQYRACFTLLPPQPGQTGRDKQKWQITYALKADDSEDFLLPAAQVWGNAVERLSVQGRVVPNPQETMLEGLGRAMRLYPKLEESLDDAAPDGCWLNPTEAYEFIKSVAWRLQDNGLSVVLPESLANQEAIANRLGLKISAQLPKRGQGGVGLNSLLQFKWELEIGGQSLTKAEFEKLAAQEIPLVEINGEWVELRKSDVKAAREFFASRKDQPNLSLEDALRITTGDAQTLSKLPVVNFESSGALEELVTTLTGNQTLTPVTPPKSFKGQLRPYQEKGVGWLSFLQQWGLGACLADDMGLGKTVQLIAFLLHLKAEKRLTGPILLVCPTSVLGNWEREAYRFGPELQVKVHHGSDRLQSSAFVKAVEKLNVIITSYTLVQRDLKTLQKVDWQGLVLDEAQNIKNAEAKQSKAVRELEVEFRIALTGTPVENRLSELWSIMDFLNPGYLGPQNFFRRRFAMPIERYGDTDSLKTLRSLVQPFILRRLKTDRTIIQDLPEKLEMPVFCGLSPAQADLYQEVVDRTMAEIEETTGIQRRGLVLALLTKLKQICNHPDLFGAEKTTKKKVKLPAGFDQGSAKLQRLDEMLEVLLTEGDRCLIFTQFAEWGKLLQAHLEQRFGGEVLFLYGSTSKAKREEMVDRFQKDPQGPRILLLSLKAGGVGLNLTRANHVFHYDRWWNPAVENQATDRAFRIGQTRNVQVHKFVCSGTLEERIHEMIESKKALAEQVVGTGEDWLTDLDSDALRDLLLLDRNAVIADE